MQQSWKTASKVNSRKSCKAMHISPGTATLCDVRIPHATHINTLHTFPRTGDTQFHHIPVLFKPRCQTWWDVCQANLGSTWIYNGKFGHVRTFGHPFLGRWNATFNLRHCRPLICLAKPINYACKLDPFNELGVAFAFPFLQFVGGWGTTLFSREKSHPFVGQVPGRCPISGCHLQGAVQCPLQNCLASHGLGHEQHWQCLRNELLCSWQWQGLLVSQQVYVAVR